MEEEVLRGGFVNRVVRVGDTVRRIPGPHTSTVHRLLAHARGRGLTWVPAPLGYDALGREVLTFAPGIVPHELPAWVWSELVLTDAARSLREWHEATLGFDAAGSEWSLDVREPREVICHNDFAPHNCVFRQAQLVAVIDFDSCAPGPRLWDIAYAAYRFVPLMPAQGLAEQGATEHSPFGAAETLARLDTFLEAYSSAGAALRYAAPDVIATAVERLRVLAAWTREHARNSGIAELAAHAELYVAHAQWLATRLQVQQGP